MSVLIAIRCDQCGELGDKPEHGAKRPAAHVLRMEAREAQWSVACWSMDERSRSGSMDFCPKCIAARETALPGQGELPARQERDLRLSLPDGWNDGTPDRGAE